MRIARVMQFIGLSIVLLAVLLLVSCEKGVGPEVEKEVDFENIPMQVTVIFYDSQQSLVESYFEFVRQDDEATVFNIKSWMEENELGGFAILSYNDMPNLNESNPTCAIHSMRIRGQRDYDRNETLGHELLHCLYGNWHPKDARF